MFEPTVVQAKLLMDFEVIPESIVVGIFHPDRNKDLGIDWKTGEFRSGSQNFYRFLVQELVPKIDATYATSGFGTLIGHSNSATFCQKVMTQEQQPFRGFIALSQHLFGDQTREFIEFSTATHDRPVFYFVASGKRDATPRLESGRLLDSLFRTSTNPNIVLQHTLYDADHNGIVGQGLGNGMAHIFSEYKHFNDWDEHLIDSLQQNNISSFDFMETHSQRMKLLYGIDFKPDENDLSLMQSMTQTDEDIERVQQFEIEHLGQNEHFYATYAQFYEHAKSYEKALEYWKTHLAEHEDGSMHFFYYKRPIQLLFHRMKQPEAAIEFAQTSRALREDLSQQFDYWIAKIAAESDVQRQVGLRAIETYIENYDEDSPVDLPKARELRAKLKG